MPSGCINCCGNCAQCCFKCCLPLPSDKFEQKDFAWVDLEEVIKHIVWKELKDIPPKHLTFAERCRPLTSVIALEVDKATVRVDVKEKSKEEKSASSSMAIPKVESNVQVLFQSTFTNDTPNTQTYSFKTERQTSSFVEISLQRGFTVGSSLDLELRAPVTPGHEEGEEAMKGRLGCRLQWSFRRGEVTRKEDRVAWCVDNNISVSDGKTGTATLSIDEVATSSEFTLTCAVKALDTQVDPKAPGQQNLDTSNEPTEKTTWFNRAMKTISCVKGSSSRPRDHGGEAMISKKDDSDHSDGERDEEWRRETRQDSKDIMEETMTPEESHELRAGRDASQTENASPPVPPPMITQPKIAVLVKRKGSGEVLKRIRVPLTKICQACPNFFKMPPKGEGTGVIYCDLKGRCHAVFALTQIVNLRECEFTNDQPATENKMAPREEEAPIADVHRSMPREEPRATDNYRSTYISRRSYFNQ